MNAHASPLVMAGDMSLGGLLAALALEDDKALVFEYGGRQVQAGYHVTEVKAGSFVALDCGGNPDGWRETILQVEDIPSASGDFMTVRKFRSILAKVNGALPLDADARLTIEIGRPDEPMRIYDVARIDIDGAKAIVRLGERPAICKPRHRAVQSEAGACCGPSAATGANACCA